MRWNHREDLAIISATARDIDTHRDAILVAMTAMLVTRTELAPLTVCRPAESWASCLLDSVLSFAGASGDGAFAAMDTSFLAVAGSSHDLCVVVEQMLVSSLETGLGSAAKAVVLNAWKAGFWRMIESTLTPE